MKVKKIKNIKKLFKKISFFCEESVKNEVCGIIGSDGENYIFQKAKNIANDPTSNFVLDPLQYLMFKNKYKTIAVFHSHVVGDEKPSDFDILMSENSCVPFVVYALNTKKYFLYTPKKPEVDLELIQDFEEKMKKHNLSVND
jgi:proteasome lid subunit RPN8/RPN11